MVTATTVKVVRVFLDSAQEKFAKRTKRHQPPQHESRPPPRPYYAWCNVHIRTKNKNFDEWKRLGATTAKNG